MVGYMEKIVKNLYCKAPVIAEGKPQFKFCTLKSPMRVTNKVKLYLAGKNDKVTENNRGELSIPNTERVAYICGLLLSSDHAELHPMFQNVHQNEMQKLADHYLNEYAKDCAGMLELVFSSYRNISNPILNDRSTLSDILVTLKASLSDMTFSDCAEKLNIKINIGELGEITKNDSELIAESGLFDEEFYYNQYPDVKEAGVDALNHFVLHGYRENRNPSSNFNTKEYSILHSLSAGNSINPLVHFILSTNL